MAHGQLHSVLRHIRRMIGVPNAEALTDRQLLERFAGQRDESAFSALVERHGALVLGVCRRVLGHEQEAEDAFQATFVVLARKAGALGWHESIANWLYEAAQRIAWKARAQAIRRQERERQAARMLRPEATADAAFHELQQVLDEELGRLPARYRAPLLLCYLEGKTRDEAAQQLGWSLGAVKGRLERGRAMLHERLVRRGLTLSIALFPTLLAQGAASAAVSAGLSQAAVQSAALACVGQGTLTASVAALSDGLLKEMFVAKLKLAAAVLLAVGVVGAGVGIAATHLAGGSPTNSAVEQAKSDGARPLSLQPRATLRLPHHGSVFALAFSPGRRVLASADHGIRQWDLASGNEDPRRLHHPGVLALAYSPDGSLLASAGEDRQIALWDSSGHEVQALKGHHHAIQALAFSPDGKLLASGGQEPTILLWDLSHKGAEPRRLDRHPNRVAALVFSANGQLLASAGGHALRLWDVAAGTELAAFGEHPSLYTSLVFLADGKLLAAGSEDRTIRVFDVARKTEIGQWRGHQGAVTALAVSPDGKLLASAGLDHAVRLWDAATGKELHCLTEHTLGVLCVAFSPDGTTLAAGGRDKFVQVWELFKE